MTVTEEFWYGNLNPQENPASGSEFLRNARRQANGIYEKIKAKLTEEQLEEVDNYMEAQGTINTEDVKNAFVHGFQMGIRLATEAFTANLT